MNRVLKYYIVLVIFVCLAGITFAEWVDPNTGNSNEVDPTVSANWDKYSVGIKVSILDNQGNSKAVAIFLNKTKSGSFSNISNKPKHEHQAETLNWNGSNVQIYDAQTFLPGAWFDANNVLKVIYNILKENDYFIIKNNILTKDVFVNKFVEGDYLMVEPMTKIDGKYGTAYELANYGRLDTNCNVENSFCWFYAGTVFTVKRDGTGGVFYHAIRLDSAIDGLPFEVFSGTREERRKGFMSKTSGLGMGIYTYREINLTPPNDPPEEPSEPSLIINKYKKGTNSLIISSSATFTIHRGVGCGGTAVRTVTTGNRGKVEVYNLEEGTYSIKETVVPYLYQELDNKCVVNEFYISNGQTTHLSVQNTATCDSELNELKVRYGESIPQNELLDLYNKFPTNNKLLNFSSPECGRKECQSNKITGCLSVDETSSSTMDFSCGSPSSGTLYNETFSLKNNLETNTFYGKAGQFLIRKVGDTTQIYDSNYNLKSKSQYIATATVKRVYTDQSYYIVCCSLDGCDSDSKNAYPPSNVPSPPKIGLQFEGATETITEPSSSFNTTSTTREYSSTFCYMSFTDYTYTYTYTYNFSLQNKVHIENLTGQTYLYKPSTLTKNYSEHVGIVSKLTATTGEIPFSINYNGATMTPSNSNKCKYEVKRELVPPSDNELNMEFRTIDTNTPFTRNTKSNWCGSDGCGSNNSTVRNEIINAPNSFSNNSKYTITLTPQDIRIIRDYNKDHPYDDYKLITRNGIKQNSFVFDLKEGRINQYSNNDIAIKTYGNLENNLIVNTR